MSSDELICPICNGLERLEFHCPSCSHYTDDCGTIKNFLGPYSPYDGVFTILSNNNTDSEDECCLHLVSCPACGKDTRVSVNKVFI